jgi:hypothetical protein
MRLLSFSTWSSFVVCAVIAVGCGGGGSTGTGGAGGGTGGSTSTDGTGGTGGSSTGGTGGTGGTSTGGTGGTSTGGSGGAGGSDCQVGCTMSEPDAFKVFQGYELKECGCAAASVCETDCPTECTAQMAGMDPMLTQESPCGACLLAEGAKAMDSKCTTTAGTTCFGDATCSPFISCVLACP